MSDRRWIETTDTWDQPGRNDSTWPTKALTDVEVLEIMGGERIWWCDYEGLGWNKEGGTVGHCVLRFPEEGSFHEDCGYARLVKEPDHE